MHYVNTMPEVFIAIKGAFLRVPTVGNRHALDHSIKIV